jgi:hypothetical protein
MTERPKLKSASEKELDKVQEQFDAFDENIKELSMDEMNKAPFREIEPQTKMAQSDIASAKDIYLKPKKAIFSKEKFNEKFRSEYEFSKQYVYFIAENLEVKGETIDCWTKCFPGVPAEEWIIPVNKPVWGPRYLAEQLTRARYHILKMDTSKPSNLASGDQNTEYYGQLVSKETVNRLDAKPATKQRSIFMGSTFK